MKLQAPKSKEARIKMLQSLKAQDFLCVWEGAIRSGKTVIALVAFAKFVMKSPGTRFLLSGRTVKTIEKNAIMGEYGLLNIIPGADYGHVGEDRAVIITVPTPSGNVTKVISVSGAADVRAYMQIHGNSYDGWFADEINVHDHAFVQEAMGRSACSPNRRNFWTLNPDNPRHWVYQEFIDRYDDDADAAEDAGGFRLWKFNPEDNPIMTEKMLRSLRATYPKGSVLYRRYILGERCLSEGLVYPYIEKCLGTPPEGLKAKYAGIDYGTDHPVAMGWYGRDPETGTWWKVREWVATKEQSLTMTNDNYMDVFEAICEELGGLNRMNLTIDPGGGGSSLIREAQKRHWNPQNPKKDVLEGIGFTARLLNSGRLMISKACTKTIEAMSIYHWDEKASARGDTVPVKIDDDPCDETRYVCTTFIEPRISRV